MISKIAVQPFSTPNSNISNIERVTIYRYVLGIWNTYDFRRQLSQCLIVEMFALLFNYMDFLLILFLLTKRLIFGYFFRHFLVSTYQETHINHFRRFVYLFQTFFFLRIRPKDVYNLHDSCANKIKCSNISNDAYYAWIIDVRKSKLYIVHNIYAMCVITSISILWIKMTSSVIFIVSNWRLGRTYVI